MKFVIDATTIGNASGKLPAIIGHYDKPVRYYVQCALLEASTTFNTTEAAS